MVMPDHNADDEKPLSPEQQNIVNKARWLMLVSGFATFLGIAVVIGVVGWRIFRSDGNAAPSRYAPLVCAALSRNSPTFRSSAR